MNRDDVLRELELLPVWKPRVPIKAALTQPVAVEKMEAVQVAIVSSKEPAFEELSSGATATLYEITISQDKHWAFICETNLPADHMDIASQGILFNNILHALSIEKTSKLQVENIVDIQAKVIVALGESVSQTLLKTQKPLENLRGKLHAIGHTQLLVTLDLAHLLNHPLDKAKVWQDLCLARSYLQGLHVQD